MSLVSDIRSYLFDAGNDLDSSFHLSLALNYLSSYLDEHFTIHDLDTFLSFADSYILDFVQDTDDFNLYKSFKNSLFIDVKIIFSKYEKPSQK